MLVLVALGGLGTYAVARGPSHGENVLWTSGFSIAHEVARGTDRPTPRAAESAVPLRQPTAARVQGTSYAFMATQEGSSVPVAYDPCRPINVVVNARTAPQGGQRLIDEALQLLGTQAGFQFSYEGLVTETAVEERRPFQLEEYGDRWAPVLIAWSDPTESPGLTGAVAGVGGSTSLVTSGSQSVYVTGMVTLDGPQLRDILSGEDGLNDARAIILHELGHLVGLAHVDDTSELMHDKNSGRRTFGPGDLSGMATLRASARCQTTL